MRFGDKAIILGYTTVQSERIQHLPEVQYGGLNSEISNKINGIGIIKQSYCISPVLHQIETKFQRLPYVFVDPLSAMELYCQNDAIGSQKSKAAAETM